MTNATQFDGDFDFLPIRAHLVFGQVPQFPTDEDFHLAVSDVCHAEDDAAAHWQVEVIRERRIRPGAAFDAATMKAINLRVAKRLYDRAMETI